MKMIPLSKGKMSIVDDDYFFFLNQKKWFALESKNRFYAARTQCENGKHKLILMHRIIMKSKKGKVVDHKNHDSLDNRRCNLRECTQAENCRNKMLHPKKPYHGISLTKNKKWCAYITKNGKLKWIGTFLKKEEAARAYDCTAKVLFGEFCSLNNL